MHELFEKLGMQKYVVIHEEHVIRTIFQCVSGSQVDTPGPPEIAISAQDGDGRIAQDEFMGPSEMFGQMDKNGDGYLEADEFDFSSMRGRRDSGEGFGGQRGGMQGPGFGFPGGILLDTAPDVTVCPGLRSIWGLVFCPKFRAP